MLSRYKKMRITVFANDEKVTVFCQPRKIGNFYKRIVQGLKAYKKVVNNKSDTALISFLTKNCFQKNGFKCKQLDETNFKVDLYNDFNVDERWTIYKGIKINNVGGSQIFQIQKTTFATEYYDDCFEIIDRELKNLI